MDTLSTKKTNIANWFEIPVKDLKRATAFYEKVFDVKLAAEEMGGMKMAMFPMDRNTFGAAGALMQHGSAMPSQTGTLVYFSTQSIEDALRRINANGGKTLLPKTGIGQYGFIAHYEDTESLLHKSLAIGSERCNIGHHEHLETRDGLQFQRV